MSGSPRTKESLVQTTFLHILHIRVRDIPCLPTPISPTPVSPTLDQKVAFRLLLMHY